MAPFGYSAWVWFKNNKWAQIIAGLGIFYLIMRAKEERDEARGARRNQRRVEEASRKAVEEAKTEDEEIIQAARRARERVSVPSPGEPVELSERADRFLFRD